MIGNSRSIVDAQATPHADLAERVARHRASPWQRPVARHSRSAFNAIEPLVAAARAEGRPVVLDSGCGTGESTRVLAERHPEALVVGVDKSSHRLDRAPPLPAHALVVRADLQDFWRLAVAAGWRLQTHYLLYPNPWPKSGHLQRRWHAHPVFPSLLALAGDLELRTNWAVYAEEFASALLLCGIRSDQDQVRADDATADISPFERKYLASGQQCLRVRARLGVNGQ